MKNNTFFYHSNHDSKKATRVTVCGVFVEERKKLVLAAVAKPMNSFSKRSGRIGSMMRTSARPFLSSSCTTFEQAKELFMPLAILISNAMENDPACYMKFPRMVGRGKVKSMMDPATISEEVAPEPTFEEKGPKIHASLINQPLQKAG